MTVQDRVEGRVHRGNRCERALEADPFGGGGIDGWQPGSGGGPVAAAEALDRHEQDVGGICCRKPWVRDHPPAQFHLDHQRCDAKHHREDPCASGGNGQCDGAGSKRCDDGSEGGPPVRFEPGQDAQAELDRKRRSEAHPEARPPGRITCERSNPVTRHHDDGDEDEEDRDAEQACAGQSEGEFDGVATCTGAADRVHGVGESGHSLPSRTPWAICMRGLVAAVGGAGAIVLRFPLSVARCRQPCRDRCVPC